MDLILTLSVSLSVALVLGYATQRIGLSPIVGYLLAGIVVGPNTPGFIANHQVAEELAEIGVVLLMFGVGLHFDLKELLAVRRVALPGAVGQSLIATGLGAVAAVALGGVGWSGAIVYGCAISVASTVVLTRVMADHDELHAHSGHIAVGWTVVEDLLTVLILVLLPALFGAPGKAPSGGLLLPLGLAVGKICLLFLATFLLGVRVIPWLLRLVAATKSRELFTLTVLVVALGIAFGSSKLFGVSMALGAFLAGMIVGRSDFSLRAASEAMPMRDAFAVLFFVSVGMLFDPRAVLEAPWLAMATLGVVILGKPIASFCLTLAFGQTLRTSASVALSLGQIGEFSFILAGMATTLGLLPQRATSVLVAAAIVSIATSPALHRLTDPISRLRPRAARHDRPLAPESSPVEPGPSPRFRAVVIGYGPVGRTLVRLLAENGVGSTVIEMNLETVRRLRDDGVEAVYGDASHRETLRAAGVERSASLILSASGVRASQEIIRMAREMNAAVRVLVRSAYLKERAALLAAGADAVFSGEGEVALAMTESVMQGLGATPEQIDRERERLRRDFGEA